MPKFEWRQCDSCESENVEFEDVTVPRWDHDSHQYVNDDSEEMLVCQDCGEIMTPEPMQPIHEND